MTLTLTTFAASLLGVLPWLAQRSPVATALALLAAAWLVTLVVALHVLTRKPIDRRAKR